MPLSSPSLRRVARLGLVAAFALLGPAACRSTAPRAVVKNAATLRVENHSDHIWHVELAPDSRGAPSPDALRWEMPARAKQIITVPAGTYHVRSRLADEANKNAPAAYERMTLRAGSTYTWPLSTLLSADTPSL